MLIAPKEMPKLMMNKYATKTTSDSSINNPQSPSKTQKDTKATNQGGVNTSNNGAQ